jgi:hypothetical protein
VKRPACSPRRPYSSAVPGLGARRLLAVAIAVAGVVAGLAVERPARASIVTLLFSGTYSTQGQAIFGQFGLDVPYQYEITYDTSLGMLEFSIPKGVLLGTHTTANPFFGYSASGITATKLTFGTQTWMASDIQLISPAPPTVSAALWFDADITMATPTRSAISFSPGGPGNGQLQLGGLATNSGNQILLLPESRVFQTLTTGPVVQTTLAPMTISQPLGSEDVPELSSAVAWTALATLAASWLLVRRRPPICWPSGAPEMCH